MSGGHFEYQQRVIEDIIDSIQEELDKQGNEKEDVDLWFSEDHYEKYPEERFYHVYREDVEKIMKDAVLQLKIAYIYAQRIDWYLSGDDDEDSLVKRIDEDLKKINKNS